MPEISLSIQKSPLLFFSLFFLVAAVSYLIYRVTVPPIPGSLKGLLILLRTCGIVAILILFFEPVLTVINRTETPPRVALLVDNSKSMQLVDAAGDRAQVLRSVLDNEIFSQLQTQKKLLPFRFDKSVEILSRFHPDSINLEGPATNISEAIKSVRDHRTREHIQLAVLISDGNYNVGPRPVYDAQHLGIPLVTIGIGDTLEQRDVLISRVLANDIAYLDTESPVDVRVRSSGYGGERVAVALKDDQRTIDEKYITLQSGTAEYEVSFSIQPEEEGLFRYTVAVDELPGEITYENNYQNFYMRVIDRRVKVLLIAGAPSQDIPFIRRTLETDETVDVQLAVQKLDGGFYGADLTGTILNDVDIIILAGFPTQHTRPDFIERFKNVVDENRTPVLFIESRNADALRIEDLLPVVVEGGRRDEAGTFVHVPAEKELNPILRVESHGRDMWNALPPIYRTNQRYVVKAGSDVVMVHRRQNIVTDEPFFVTRSVGGRKSAALLGYGIWRWRMMGRGAIDGEKLFDHFLTNTVHWLALDEEEKRVRVVTSREHYSTMEQIEFIAQVYDEQYRPFPNADIRVKVTSDEDEYETILNPIGHGRYEGALNPLPEGDYRYNGEAFIEGASIGEDDGRFSVGAVNIEFFDTQMNIQVMRQLAAITGGMYLHPNEIDMLGEYISTLETFDSRVTIATADYQLWNLPIALAVMILFFSLEWFLRKRNGML